MEVREVQNNSFSLDCNLHHLNFVSQFEEVTSEEVLAEENSLEIDESRDIEVARIEEVEEDSHFEESKEIPKTESAASKLVNTDSHCNDLTRPRKSRSCEFYSLKGNFVDAKMPPLNKPAMSVPDETMFLVEALLDLKEGSTQSSQRKLKHTFQTSDHIPSKASTTTHDESLVCNSPAKKKCCKLLDNLPSKPPETIGSSSGGPDKYISSKPGSAESISERFMPKETSFVYSYLDGELRKDSKLNHRESITLCKGFLDQEEELLSSGNSRNANRLEENDDAYDGACSEDDTMTVDEALINIEKNMQDLNDLTNSNRQNNLFNNAVEERMTIDDSTAGMSVCTESSRKLLRNKGSNSNSSEYVGSVEDGSQSFSDSSTEFLVNQPQFVKDGKVSKSSPSKNSLGIIVMNKKNVKNKYFCKKSERKNKHSSPRDEKWSFLTIHSESNSDFSSDSLCESEEDVPLEISITPKVREELSENISATSVSSSTDSDAEVYCDKQKPDFSESDSTIFDDNDLGSVDNGITLTLNDLPQYEKEIEITGDCIENMANFSPAKGKRKYMSLKEEGKYSGSNTKLMNQVERQPNEQGNIGNALGETHGTCLMRSEDHHLEFDRTDLFDSFGPPKIKTRVISKNKREIGRKVGERKDRPILMEAIPSSPDHTNSRCSSNIPYIPKELTKTQYCTNRSLLKNNQNHVNYSAGGLFNTLSKKRKICPRNVEVVGMEKPAPLTPKEIELVKKLTPRVAKVVIHKIKIHKTTVYRQLPVKKSEGVNGNLDIELKNSRSKVSDCSFPALPPKSSSSAKKFPHLFPSSGISNHCVSAEVKNKPFTLSSHIKILPSEGYSAGKGNLFVCRNNDKVSSYPKKIKSVPKNLVEAAKVLPHRQENSAIQNKNLTTHSFLPGNQSKSSNMNTTAKSEFRFISNPLNVVPKERKTLLTSKRFTPDQTKKYKPDVSLDYSKVNLKGSNLSAKKLSSVLTRVHAGQSKNVVEKPKTDTKTLKRISIASASNQSKTSCSKPKFICINPEKMSMNSITSTSASTAGKHSKTLSVQPASNLSQNLFDRKKDLSSISEILGTVSAPLLKSREEVAKSSKTVRSNVPSSLSSFHTSPHTLKLKKNSPKVSLCSQNHSVTSKEILGGNKIHRKNVPLRLNKSQTLPNIPLSDIQMNSIKPSSLVPKVMFSTNMMLPGAPQVSITTPKSQSKTRELLSNFPNSGSIGDGKSQSSLFNYSNTTDVAQHKPKLLSNLQSSDNSENRAGEFQSFPKSSTPSVGGKLNSPGIESAARTPETLSTIPGQISKYDKVCLSDTTIADKGVLENSKVYKGLDVKVEQHSDGSHISQPNKTVAKSRTSSIDSESTEEASMPKDSPLNLNDPFSIKKSLIAAMGINIPDYDKFFEDCKNNREKHDKLLSLMRENGLKGRPSLENCVRARKRLEKEKNSQTAVLEKPKESEQDSLNNNNVANVKGCETQSEENQDSIDVTKSDFSNVELMKTDVVPLMISESTPRRDYRLKKLPKNDKFTIEFDKTDDVIRFEVEIESEGEDPSG